MIAVSVSLVLGVTGFVLAQSIARAVRLSGSCTSYANLLQTARIRAVQDDRYYAVVSDTVANPPRAFVDINGNGLYDTGAHDGIPSVGDTTAIRLRAVHR